MSENKVNHLGVIMDGNRRWARKHMLESVMRGHEKGLDTFMNICTWCQDENIPYLSVYAFSTENWERSIEEVSSLFKLMEKFFTDEIEDKDAPLGGLRAVQMLGPADEHINLYEWKREI